jgi:RNA polymerase sigma-70 factor (ECF subfamily)
MGTPSETLSPDMGPPPPPSTVRALITGLIRAHSRLVYHAARQIGVLESDVDDVAQDVFVRLTRSMEAGDLDTSRSIDGWLRLTTFRVFKDRKKLARHAREIVSATGEVDAVDEAPDPEGRMQAIDVQRAVHAVLDELRPEQRVVLVMSDMWELPMSEIAVELGIPEGTGYSRLRAGRAAFEEKWKAKRASRQMALLPFAAWDARDLFAAARPVPAAPPGFEDAIAARVAASVAAGLVGPAGAATGAAAAKAGVLLTSGQIAAGVVVAMIAGAAIHAAFGNRDGAPVTVAPMRSAVAASERPAAMETALATAIVETATAASTDEAGRGGTAPHASDAKSGAPAPPSEEANERNLLVNARAAIERGDPQAALGFLSRVKSPRHAAERENLRRLVLAYQDGGR